MDKPLILLVDDQSDFVGLAHLLQEEEYPFIYANLNTTDKQKQIGKGLINDAFLNDDYWSIIYHHKPQDLIIVLPDQHTKYQWEVLKRQGYTIIGSGDFAEEMEYDREKGMNLLRSIGLKTPPEEDFTSLADALKYMESQEEDARKYFKGSGEDFAGNSYTYGAKNKQDMISYLTWLKDDTGRKNITIKNFILQDKIDGFTVDFSFYFDGQHILPGSIALDIEEKKGGDGTYGGSALGCSSNYIYFLTETKYKKYLENLAVYLKKENYVGQWSINNVFRESDGEAFALENTSRFGHDSFETEMLMHKANGKNVSDFILALAGKKTFEFPKEMVGYGVRIHCDYPTTEKKKIEGRYFTIDESIKNNLYFYQVYKNGEQYGVVDNPVGVAVTTGDTLTGPVKRMNEQILPHIYLSDMFTRSTPPDKTKEAIAFLHKYRWI